VNFKYKNDEMFFKKMLEFLNIDTFLTLFDFSEPIEKRKEFNKIKKKFYNQLML
jgi:hypothetical protein